MRSLSEIDRDSQLARQHSNALDVVLMLMSDQDGIDSGRIFAGDLHTLEQFAAGKTRIDQYLGPAARDKGAVPLGA